MSGFYWPEPDLSFLPGTKAAGLGEAEKAEVSHDQKWNEIGKKSIRKLIETLTQDNYEVSGKTTFKEEFVTCGGINLDEIDMQNMKSKVSSNIYFAGEILNIDAITGGYNFQAAWSGGYVAGKLG